MIKVWFLGRLQLFLNPRTEHDWEKGQWLRLELYSELWTKIEKTIKKNKQKTKETNSNFSEWAMFNYNYYLFSFFFFFFPTRIWKWKTVIYIIHHILCVFNCGFNDRKKNVKLSKRLRLVLDTRHVRYF